MEFLALYGARKSQVLDDKHVLEAHSQDDVTVLQVCRVFRREFLHIGNIEVFLESLTIASACNKVFSRRFLKPDTIGPFPSGGYTCKNRYRKKAIMW